MPKPHRKSPCLPDYDYAAEGAYFIKVCTHKRRMALGAVNEEVVRLTPEGEIVQNVWNELPKHYPKIELDAFVIMPNHVHGIIWIKNQTVVGE